MILSYTLLNTWEICPHQAARRYILKDIPFEETEAMEYGKRVHKAFEERIRRKIPLPVDLESHEPLLRPLDRVSVRPEQRLGVTHSGRACEFFAPDVWLRGVLDAPVPMSSSVAVLLDWKTGKPREDSFELEVQALLLQAHDPSITQLYGQYVWLQENRRGKLHDVSDTKRTWARVQALADEIDNRRYDKTPGPLCAWCPVKDCEHNHDSRRQGQSQAKKVAAG